MNSILYPESEPLSHKDSENKYGSIVWKFLYKRLIKNVDKEIINIGNFKKIVFNKNINNPFVIEELELPLILRQDENLDYEAENGKYYYIPLSIAFCSQNIRFDISLVEGELEFRNTEINENEVCLHRPMLFIQDLRILEKCFKNILEKIEKQWN